MTRRHKPWRRQKDKKTDEQNDKNSRRGTFYDAADPRRHNGTGGRASKRVQHRSRRRIRDEQHWIHAKGKPENVWRNDGGLAFRYVCEKYFNTICSVQAEVNYAKIGWKEDILDLNDAPVINPQTGAAEEYSRTINYIQIPVFAHLAWGKEKKGMQFFFQAGPQVGIWLSESTEASYDLSAPNLQDRANRTVAQETMPVENKFDYGIAAGLGMEYSHPKAGHLQLEGRYYYGLGNIYGDSKKDYFGKSNFGNIVVKLTYLFDLTK